MIDSTTETLISFSDAAKTVIPRRRGRRTHLSTLHRWATSGIRGIVLETLVCGGCRVTSREALQRFFERLSGPRQPETSRGYRTPAKRQRDSEAAERELIETGA
jgi:hypothetical protein